jgi:hypothetical protein
LTHGECDDRVPAVLVDRTSRSRRGLLAILAFAAIYWVADLSILRAGVPDPLDDTWEYGVVARSLLAGHGFRTGVIHPPLWSLRDAHGTVPVLVHGPLMPLAIAPAIGGFGPGALDRVAWLGAAFALLAAWGVFCLGARHFGPDVGVAAAALFTVSPLTLEAVHHDPSLAIGAFLLARAIDLVTRERPRPIAAGLAIGLAGLARPEMSIAAIVLLFAVGRAWWRTALAAVACAAPWWLHAARATGQPFFNLSAYLLVGYWDGRPGLSVLRDFGLTPDRWPETLRRAAPALPEKWLECLPHAVKRALLAPSGGTGWLALAGAISIPSGTRRLLGLALPLAALPVAIMTATVYDARYLAPFLPLWTIAAAVGARALARRLPAWAHRPRFWIGALALLAMPSTAPALREAAREARGLERRLAGERAALAPLVANSGAIAAPVFSDTPDFVAWTTGRTVIWVTRGEFERLTRGDEARVPGLPLPEDRALLRFHAADSSGGWSPPP